MEEETAMMWWFSRLARVSSPPVHEGAVPHVVHGLVVGEAHRHPEKGRQGGRQDVGADEVRVHQVVAAAGQKMPRASRI